MKNLEAKQTEIIETFAAFDDWMDRYQYLIELGNELKPLPESEKIDKNLIDGCQSRVWLVADEHDGVITFRGESDAVIVKGIVALLVDVLSGSTPDEIIESDLHFVSEIGLQEHLSPTRSNGLLAMIKQMKLYAAVIKNRS